MKTGAAQWAREEFGRTNLGDVRRTRRLVTMAAGVARRPSGKVSAVFTRSAEREGAYDFLENPQVSAEALAESMFAATAARAAGAEFVYVVIDGTALSLTDENGAKGFGPVGSPNAPVKGLKVMNALAVARDGTPLGLIDQIFWNRPPTEVLTRAERTKRNQVRPFEDKETYYFALAAEHAIERLERVGVRAWIVIDREADNRDILLALHDLSEERNCLFTVRFWWNRRLSKMSEGSVKPLLDAQPSLGTFDVEIGRTGRRPARTAKVDVRSAVARLKFSRRGTKEPSTLTLYAVSVREIGGDADALDWMLYTNVPVLSLEHAQRIVEIYRARWRIEDFHRTWKQGECNVEDAQLRSADAIVKWATLVAAVATRIERLKYLSRKKPNEPASIELSLEEIEALKLERRSRARPKRPRLPEMPTIEQATHWLAELGGWIGPRNGPPGSTTIARGLERLGYLVEGIALARRQPPAGVKTT